MALNTESQKRRFQYSLRTMLLMFVPVALLTTLSKWLFFPPPIDVAMAVERFSECRNPVDGHICLVADVTITNRSHHTVWYSRNPRYYTAQRVNDGRWRESSVSSRDLEEWGPLNDGQSMIIHVPIRQNATSMKVVVAFTTDRFMPKRHWMSTSEIRIVRKGQEIIAETGRGTDTAHPLDSLESDYMEFWTDSK